MTTDPSIRDQSYAYFLQEAPELLQVLEQELLSLPENWDVTKFHTLMRVTHTLKGAAASVGLESIKTIAHSLEDIFKALCQPEVTIDPEIEALLFEGYECLRLPLMAELSGQTNDAEVFNRAAAVFAQLQAKLGDCFGETAYIPTSVELGFDMTQSIFEVGVAQRLEQLATAIASETPQAIASTLQTQAEVFLGLAESLNLPGFGAIAQAAIAAINQHPERAVIIAQTALVDWQQGQAAVLAGDRTTGGEVSATLQQLAVEVTEQQWSAATDLERLAPELAAEPVESLLEAIWTTSEPPPQPAPQPEPVLPSPTVRINVEHLERLNYLVGELLTNQNRQTLADDQLQAKMQELTSALQQQQQMLEDLQSWSAQQQLVQPQPEQLDLQNLVQSLRQSSEQLTALATAIDSHSRQSRQTQEKQRLLFTHTLDDLLAARMIPLGEIFNRLPRMLQQLETRYHKPVALKLSGTEILLDKAVAEKLYDPLLHLVRNAFDHGIEPPEIRQQLGKARTGQIEIRAFHQGSHLTIEVRDDGQGLNYQRICQRAVELNLISSEQAGDINEAQLMDLLFEPGFSTAAEVSNLSGRGVGLDAVRAQLEALQGAITLYSEPQRGTTFILQVPFSLTMAKLLFCQAGTATYAVLTEAIEQVLIPQPEQIRTWESGKALSWGKDAQQLIPLTQLGKILNYLSPVTAPATQLPQPPLPVVILRHQEQIIGLEVDQLIGEQESVIRPLGSMIVPPDYVYGSSILADGQPTLVIDGAALVKYVFEQYSKARPSSASVSFNSPVLSANPFIFALQHSAATVVPATILLVDDSLTQRQTLALTLQKSGYQVVTAEDGEDAIAKILHQPEIQLIICDLEMPRMNGFEFLNYRRQDRGLQQIPVVILTSHQGEQQRLIAIEFGAAAYLNKPCSESQLLATIAELLPQQTNTSFQ